MHALNLPSDLTAIETTYERDHEVSNELAKLSRIRVNADGNCLFRSLSIALRGNEIHHKISHDQVKL